MVGGAYLCGGEMWARFIWMMAAGEGSRVMSAYMKWVTGLAGARLERCRGWTSLCDLDEKALVAAVWVFEDARRYEGLLGRAVRHAG